MTEFFAPGLPQPKGSMRGFVVRSKATGRSRAVLTNNSTKTKPWEHVVRFYAEAAGLKPSEGPMMLYLAFYLPRPKTVKRDQPTVKPDIDKLVRSCMDALTGIAWVDDAQVTKIEAVKFYEHGAPGPGVRVRVGAA